MALAEATPPGKTDATKAAAPPAAKAKKEQVELTEEDRALQEQLALLITRLQDLDAGLHGPALSALKELIRSSTASMTSVPKPLKFLGPHVPLLRDIYTKGLPMPADQTMLADILSVVMKVYGEEGKRESLVFYGRGSKAAIGDWGHEYVQHLSMEIQQEYHARDEGADMSDLRTIVAELIPFYLKHNAEVDACDLARELDLMPLLSSLVDEHNQARITQYLLSCVPYEDSPDNIELLRVVYGIHERLGHSVKALMIALRLDDQALIDAAFGACSDPHVKKQMAFIIGRQGAHVTGQDELAGADEGLAAILGNRHLHGHYAWLAREFDVVAPKTPADIYKTHLENVRYPSAVPALDPSRANLVTALSNGLLNAGFGVDKLVLQNGLDAAKDGEIDETKSLIYGTKGSGLISSVASIGLLHLWNVDEALVALDKYLATSKEDGLKAGALLAIGIVSAGVTHEADAALAILAEHTAPDAGSPQAVRLAALMGLGLAYAGARKEAVLELLQPLLESGGGDSSDGLPVYVSAALSLALIFAGSGHIGLTDLLVTWLMEQDASGASLGDGSWASLLPVALALLYLGRGGGNATGSAGEVEPLLEALRVVPGRLGMEAYWLVTGCAYVGTGNVLKIQECLRCIEQTEEDDKQADEEGDAADAMETEADDAKETDKKEISYAQAYAVIATALIAQGEDIGTDMLLRTLRHTMHYGDERLKRAVPIALALLHVSNPKAGVMDALAKYSHDAAAPVAHAAILSLGLVGAGTNHARLAQILRQLAAYHHKDGDALFCTRLAQGLLHAGKGLLTLAPAHADRGLLRPVSVAALLVWSMVAFHAGAFLLAPTSDSLSAGRAHFVYYLVPAMRPRMLLTLDQDTLEPLPVTVRVGQAVETVGQAGRPKTITGFQTHQTPVLVHLATERAELATEQYIPLTHVLEDVVLLRKNPNWEPDQLV